MLAIELAKRGKRVYAVDYSEGMLKKAKEKIDTTESKIKNRISTHLEDITNLDFNDGMFDGVACINVLFFLKNPYATMKKAYKVLTRNGIFVLSSLKPGLNTRGKTEEQIAEECKGKGIDTSLLEKALVYKTTLQEKKGITYTPAKTELEETVKRMGFKINLFEDIYGGDRYFVKLVKR